jgi:hypothetical protein
MEPLVIAQKGPSSHALASVQQISPRGKRYRQTNCITTTLQARTVSLRYLQKNAATKHPITTLKLQSEPHADADSLDTSIYRVPSSHASHY